MFFSRRKKERAHEREDRRGEYRCVLPADHPVSMTVERADGSRFEAEPLDLSVRGASFRTSGDGLDVLVNEEVVDLVISIGEGLDVRTPGVARRRVDTENGTEWGVEFINLGNLYGQWDNVLGHYLNRRSLMRVKPALDQGLAGSLFSEGHKMKATVCDLNVQGAGLLVGHIEAALLRMGAPARVTFCLPGSKKELVGPARIQHCRRLDQQDIVGLAFDLGDPEGFARHEREIAAYCSELSQGLSRWEEGLQEDVA